MIDAGGRDLVGDGIPEWGGAASDQRLGGLQPIPALHAPVARAALADVKKLPDNHP